MSCLLGTNIISEVRKGARCDPKVSAWYAPIADEDLFPSTLVLGEIRKGVELARRLDRVESAFGRRGAHGRQCGRRSMGTHERRPTHTGIDGLLAAMAVTNRLTLVTRNDRQVAGLGDAVLDPFE